MNSIINDTSIQLVLFPLVLMIMFAVVAFGFYLDIKKEKEKDRAAKEYKKK
jgi:general stress protein CsbA